jgi:hypothetical protein
VRASSIETVSYEKAKFDTAAEHDVQDEEQPEGQ